MEDIEATLETPVSAQALRIVKKWLPDATHVVKELSYAQEKSSSGSAWSKRRQEASRETHGEGTSRERT